MFWSVISGRDRSFPGPCLLYLLCLVFLAWSGMSATCHVIAQVHCPTKRNSTLKLQSAPGAKDIRAALDLESGNWAVHIQQALYFERQAAQMDQAGKIQKRDDLDQKAVGAWKRALIANPVQGWVWYDLGIALTRVRSDGHESASSFNLVDSIVQQAVRLRPSDPELLFAAGRYWLWRSQRTDLSPEDPPMYARLFQKAVAYRSSLWKEVAEEVWAATHDEELIVACLPQDPKWAKRLKQWVKKQADS